MMTISSLLADSLLVDLRTYRVDQSRLCESDSTPLSILAAKSVATGMAELLTGDAQENNFGAAIAIPIFRSGEVTSVAVLALAPKEIGAGVFEIWEPVGPFEEVRLRAGYFARLERFSNVSSFVRFEKGSGLPGQVWSAEKAIIHDELSEHPGFLRAAGASAGLLSTAIGIPVIDETLVSAVVLISSAATPIARAYEVWTVDDESFVLDNAAYQNVPIEHRISMRTRLPHEFGLPGLVMSCEGAIATDHADSLGAGRASTSSPFVGGLAIPFFAGDELHSVTTLLF